jgi:hypothetical protein
LLFIQLPKKEKNLPSPIPPLMPGLLAALPARLPHPSTAPFSVLAGYTKKESQRKEKQKKESEKTNAKGKGTSLGVLPSLTRDALPQVGRDSLRASICSKKKKNGSSHKKKEQNRTEPVTRGLTLGCADFSVGRDLSRRFAPGTVTLTRRAPFAHGSTRASIFFLPPKHASPFHILLFVLHFFYIRFHQRLIVCSTIIQLCIIV